MISLVRGSSPMKMRASMPTPVIDSDLSPGNLSMSSCGRAGGAAALDVADAAVVRVGHLVDPGLDAVEGLLVDRRAARACRARSASSLMSLALLSAIIIQPVTEVSLSPGFTP